MKKEKRYRKMVCTHCGYEIRTSGNERASKFGLPPCPECGHKNFEPSSSSLLNEDLLTAEDAKLERSRNKISGSIIRKN